MTNNVCWFSDCNNTDTLFCNICKKWLCDDCRNNYWKRMKAFGKEILNK